MQKKLSSITNLTNRFQAALYGDSTSTLQSSVRKTAYALIAMSLISIRAQAFTTNKVEKVFDFSFGQLPNGDGYGGYAPLDRFTQVGTNLWFTTSKGGAADVGTISRFDLTTHKLTQVGSLYDQPGNYTGKNPESSLFVIGHEGFFTANSGGSNKKGTLAKIDLDSGAVTVLYTFSTNGLLDGASPRAGFTQIGDDLWTTTSTGGTSNRGVVLKYSLSSGSVTTITNLDGPLLGGQSYAGFTQAGDSWYFTTFTGGNTFQTTNYPTITLGDGSERIITNSLTLGAGTLGRLSFDNLGNPVVTRVLNLPGGYEQFPALEPTLVGTNSLYFSSTGPNALPGAILRYDLNTGFFTNLFSFSSNAPSALAYGTRPGYSGLTEWLGELYFINRLGGVSNLGAVVKFNIASNTVIKLADFDGNKGSALGNPSGFFGTGTVVLETNRFYIYYPVTSGGVNNLGTIIRVALPPQPITATSTLLDTKNLTLAWTGGYPPFDIVSSSDLSTPVANWNVVITNITSAVNTTNWSITLPIADGNLFYSVRGQTE